MKRILIATVIASLVPFTSSIFADDKGNEQRKYYEEQRREGNKHREE